MKTKPTIDALKATLPRASWSQDPDGVAPFLREWRDRWVGKTPILLRPKTTAEVVQAVKICAAYKMPITIQGGNTGLVGGQIPQGEVLLSTSRLNTVRETDVDNMHMVCGAGVTLLQAQQVAENIGLKFPLSLASEGTCTIGGNLSTNAGGVHVLKYGTARALVFGVEAVLANGQIFNDLKPLRKDNTGYALSQLLMGAEGTLGILTAASLKLYPKPTQTITVMAAVQSPSQALALLSEVRSETRLAMFELIAHLGMDYVTKHIPNQSSPFKDAHPWYVLFEWEFADEGDHLTFAETVLQKVFEHDVVRDAVIAKSGIQAQALLALRENLSAAQKPIGATIKHDIAVPISAVPAFIEQTNAAVLKAVPSCRPLPFGHLGDGNIHYNIGQPANMSAAAFMAFEPQINDIVYDSVGKFDGSISAEHGIGILKKQQLARRDDKAKLDTLRRIKTAMDPDNILNPRVLL